MASAKSDAKNAYTAVEAWKGDNPGTVIPGEVIVSGTPATTYTSARATTGNTVTVTAATGAIGVSSVNLKGTYEIDSTGVATDKLSPL